MFTSNLAESCQWKMMVPVSVIVYLIPVNSLGCPYFDGNLWPQCPEIGHLVDKDLSEHCNAIQRTVSQ